MRSRECVASNRLPDGRGCWASQAQPNLRLQLARRLKGDGFLALLGRIIDSCPAAPGRGLPIGSLTSQHFANHYLDGADRFLLDHPLVCAHVRRMDDIVSWATSCSAVTTRYKRRHCTPTVRPGENATSNCTLRGIVINERLCESHGRPLGKCSNKGGHRRRRPRVARRLVEQQRQERAFRQPEQERAWQPQPQHRVPARPSSGVDATGS